MQVNIQNLRRDTLGSMVRYWVILISMIVCFVSKGMTTDYYVATNGNNNNDGSLARPWLSLKHAIEVAGAGDTIFMRGGTYTPNEVWIKDDMGGANGQYLTIKNYPGETVSIGGSRWLIVDGPYVRIEGLHFRLPYSVDASSYSQIVNNTFIGPQAGYGVIFAGGNNVLIEGNWIEITGDGDTQDHGIYLVASQNVVIRNNFISGASGYTIHIYDEDRGSGATKTYKNILVENNFLTSSRARAGIILGPHDPTIKMDGITIRNNVITNHPWEGILIEYEPISNVSIINNTIHGNVGGISIFNQVTNLTIRNNIFSGNGQTHLDISGKIPNAQIDHNLYYQPQAAGNGAKDSQPFYGNPLFVDAAAKDFHLKESSPAINVGIDVGIPYTGSAPDIGAFEYGMKSVVVDNDGELPEQINLYQNYPNPFNPTTEIEYSLPYDADVELIVFDLTGRQVKTLVNAKESSGLKTVTWDGTDENNRKVASGMYLYRLKADNFSVARRMMLIR